MGFAARVVRGGVGVVKCGDKGRVEFEVWGDDT